MTTTALIPAVAVAAALAATAAAAGPPVASAPGLLVSYRNAVFVEGRRIGAGTQAVWSPDGSRIAFIRGGELHVANADGSQDRRLTRRAPGLHWPANSPDWSPTARTSPSTGRGTCSPSASPTAGS